MIEQHRTIAFLRVRVYSCFTCHAAAGSGGAVAAIYMVQTSLVSLARSVLICAYMLCMFSF